MDKRDIKRIAQTVKAFENNPRNSIDRQRHRPYPITGFWAELGEHGEDGKYSWKRIGWNPNGAGSFSGDEELGEGFNDKDNYAIELDKEEKFPEGLVVWLTPVPNEDFLCFKCDDFFEGRGVGTSSGSSVQVELKFKSSFTNITVTASNGGGFTVNSSQWCKVQYLRGAWILNASKC